MTVTVAVWIREEIVTVTTGAGGILGDMFHHWPQSRILKGRRDSADVTIAALIRVDLHRVVDKMATNTERRVEDMAEACRFGTMIDTDMGQGGFSVLMTTQTVHRGLVGIGNNHRHGDACWSQQADITGGVMAGDAAIKVIGMGGQDIRPVQDGMTM